MSFDKPTGLQTTPLQTVHVETSQWSTAGAAPASASVPVGAIDGNAVPPRRRSLPFTSVALVSAVAMLIAEGVAVNLAITGSLAAATTMAVLLMWMTAIPFLLGLVGLVLGSHRGWAIAAMIVSVIANPFLLRMTLSFFGGLS